jgi:tetratricopeptide (TPR) repeat protein
MAYNNRALTFIKTGQYEKGEKDLKTSVTINPNCISANFNLSQFLFELGNVKDAYKYISKVTQKDLSNNPNKVEAWRLQGQIETELCKYDDAINSFNEAIYQGGYDSALNSFNEAIFQGRNYYFLLWITYIKYLKAEYNFEKNSAKQNELLHSIIRDLNKSLYSLEKDRSLLKKKNRKKNTSGMESHEIDYISNTMIEIYCTLGCIYYKMEDYYTAKNKLLECVCLCKEVNKGKNSYDIEVIKRKKIEETATELVLKIWDFNIKPIWWRWWLDYPIGSKNKQIFRFLSGLLFILLFFHPLYPVLLGRLSAFIQSANSSVDWLLYIILVTILIFIILSPCLNRIKIKEVEIEISSPPSLKFEYSPVSYFEQMGDMLQKKEGLNNI